MKKIILSENSSGEETQLEIRMSGLALNHLLSILENMSK